MSHNKNNIPIIHLDRDDLVTAGFNPNVSDAMLERMADKMADYYLVDFQSVLFDVCRSLKVKEIN